MKRIHLFEFEDFAWFPSWLRDCMTRFIVVFHKGLGTSDTLSGLVEKALKHSDKKEIIDICSGSGGPMLDVLENLKTKKGLEDLKLTFSDLYPHQETAKAINSEANPNISYLTTPVNATNIDRNLKGVRTMICSLHHMPPSIAKGILKDAKDAHQPICIYEISDNSVPKLMWWLAFPISFVMVFIMTFFVTPFIRPMTWQQLVFTYLIPIIPIFVAWDGTVSNLRTYTLSDMDELLKGLNEDVNYTWEKGSLKGPGGGKLYLLGLPN